MKSLTLLILFFSVNTQAALTLQYKCKKGEIEMVHLRSSQYENPFNPVEDYLLQWGGESEIFVKVSEEEQIYLGSATKPLKTCRKSDKFEEEVPIEVDFALDISVKTYIYGTVCRPHLTRDQNDRIVTRFRKRVRRYWQAFDGKLWIYLKNKGFIEWETREECKIGRKP